MKQDLSTIGVKVGYAVETTAGTKPTAFTWLQRCKAVDGIELTADKIDVTALEDAIKQYTDGVQDTGGDWGLTFGVNDDVITALTKMKTDSTAGKNASKATWFVVYFPALTKSFFVKATPGNIPLPEIGQGNAAEIKINCTINQYVGLDTAIEPTAGE